MKACFRPKAKWCCEKNADGGSSVEYGFELGSAAFDGSPHRPLIDCQSGWRFPQFFAAAIGSKNEPSSLGLTGGAAPPPYIKSNRSSGWIFFAYTRVFIGVPEGSCGLRGFSGRPEIHHFCSLRADSLRSGEHPKRP